MTIERDGLVEKLYLVAGQPAIERIFLHGTCLSQLLREAAAALSALKREWKRECDDLAAEIEADKFRKQALQDSIDGCAQKVQALSARLSAAQRSEVELWIFLQTIVEFDGCNDHAWLVRHASALLSERSPQQEEAARCYAHICSGEAGNRAHCPACQAEEQGPVTP